MTRTILQMCYDFQIIEGLSLDEELVMAMAFALGVDVIFTPEDPSSEQGYDPVNKKVRLYQVKGSDLKMAIGYDADNRHACGRLVTPFYIEHTQKIHAAHVDGEYFDMMNVEARFGELLGVFIMLNGDDPYDNQ
ncbi:MULTISPECIES: hypothetical protein [unclassified Yoonia]|uniref:hypothetical protein n=1 Tax=unclassified Yoonia TaxID=2629118 RepID=UPI002AFDDA21|nr:MULTISPECIES: hypothetical protein [unclassified Yoonia]